MRQPVLKTGAGHTVAGSSPAPSATWPRRLGAPVGENHRVREEGKTMTKKEMQKYIDALERLDEEERVHLANEIMPPDAD